MISESNQVKLCQLADLNLIFTVRQIQCIEYLTWSFCCILVSVWTIKNSIKRTLLWLFRIIFQKCFTHNFHFVNPTACNLVMANSSRSSEPVLDEPVFQIELNCLKQLWLESALMHGYLIFFTFWMCLTVTQTQNVWPHLGRSFIFKWLKMNDCEDDTDNDTVSWPTWRASPAPEQSLISPWFKNLLMCTSLNATIC